MQSLTVTIIKASEKIAKLKFLPQTDTRPAGRPNTDHYIDLRFSCESETPQFVSTEALLTCHQLWFKMTGVNIFEHNAPSCSVNVFHMACRQGYERLK